MVTATTLNTLDRFDASSGLTFDMTNLFSTAEFTNIATDACKDLYNSHATNPLDPTFATTVENKYGIKLLGQYSETENSSGGFNPKVDFTSTGGGSVVTDVTADATSPDSSAVDWLQMEAISGSLAKTVFLIDTVLGQQPIGGVGISRSVAGTRN